MKFHSPIALVLLLISALASGCSTVCCHYSAAADPVTIKWRTMPDSGVLDVKIFEPPVTAGQEPMRILLLHEVTGLNAENLRFAQMLADRGFTVYAPVILGSPGESSRWSTWRNFVVASISPAWPTLIGGRSPWVVPQLRELLHKISLHGEPVGVIGQCITGSIPLALMSENGVQIAAMCQPALPFLRLTRAASYELALSPDDVEAGIRRINDRGLLVMGFRFQEDDKSTMQRFKQVETLLAADVSQRPVAKPGRFEDHSIYDYDSDHIPHDAHSVFCEHFVAGGGQTKERFDELVAGFKSALARNK